MRKILSLALAALVLFTAAILPAITITHAADLQYSASLSTPTTKVFNSTTGVSVSWNEISGATGYKVYRSAGADGYSCIATITGSNVLNFTDKTAESGTAYRYYVRAINSTYKSGYASKKIVRLETPSTKVSNSTAGVKVSWDEISGATGYKVYRSAGSGDYSCIKTITGCSNLSYTDETAKSGTTYRYYVRAINGSYQSGYTSQKIIRLDTPVVKVSNSTAGVKITWNEISGAAGYKVYRATTSGNFSCIKTIEKGSTLTFTDESAKSGTTYRYYVRAINGSYQSGYSYKKIMRLETPKTLVSVSPNCTADGVTISWNAIVGASEYKIYRKIDDESYTCIAAIKGSDKLSFIDSNVNDHGKYRYYVKSCNGSYSSGYTSQAFTYELYHSHQSTVVPPTCIANGYTSHVCSICKHCYKDAEITATGHQYGDWEVIKRPTKLTPGSQERVCSACGYTESKETPKLELDDDIVVYYEVVDGVVIDLVSGKTMSGAVVDGDYFSGGTVSLPSSYQKATIETVMIYNRESTDPPIGNGLSYYGGAFLFQEVVNPSNWGLIKVPFGGGQIPTNFRLNATINYNKRVLGNGDSYWCLAFEKDSGTYSLQINDDYVEKAHWSNYINKSFTLSKEHKFKSFIVRSSRLTESEIMENYKETGISSLSENTTLVGRVTNGLTDLGSALAFTKKGTSGIPTWYATETKAGAYSVDNNNGMTLNYEITDFETPDNNVDNSGYESVHIIKKPETLYVDYKYALAAVPYPFDVNHAGKSDQYDVAWKSSDETVASVIDGLLIPKKTGTVTVTATLTGTSMSDSVTIKIIEKESKADSVVAISENYISKNGNRFSSTDYEMTTNAIYDAITEAYEDGYNHVVFPKINFYAAPTGTTYYIPTGMTVEFPEGSAFYMKENELGKTSGYTYFSMGWGWWSCNVPREKAYAKTDDNGNVLGYYCMDAHLIIDKYYGEFYEENSTVAERYAGANKYAWGCTLLSIGKRAQYCTVEIREANCPTGFFITMGGKGNSEIVNGGASGAIKTDMFVSGWLNDDGELVENSNWISTTGFLKAELCADGSDSLHEYYLGDWEHNVTKATQHLYDILWYDENYELLEIYRWQYVDEGYVKPAGAKYFKISVQQSELPDWSGEYMRLCPDEASKFCEIRNTKIIDGADGLASVVGATEACWIHDNYVSNDGYLNGSCWSLDLEDGWQGMRGTIIEHNILRKYTYAGSVGDYRGMDTGVLALSSGYNTFVISNYLGSIAQSNGNVVNTHIINNVIHTMYSSISGGRSKDINPKIWAHVYCNIIGDSNIAENTSANGVVYHHGNTYANYVNQY